jgi:hypothetical protein
MIERVCPSIQEKELSVRAKCNALHRRLVHCRILETAGPPSITKLAYNGYRFVALLSLD